jgi:hypothetical protein
MIKQGDPVRVRLHTGEVVDAVYEYQTAIFKAHWVVYCGKFHLASKFTDDRYKCRFVGPPAIRGAV